MSPFEIQVSVCSLFFLCVFSAILFCGCKFLSWKFPEFVNIFGYGEENNRGIKKDILRRAVKIVRKQ
jgi:hypothetical protein